MIPAVLAAAALWLLATGGAAYVAPAAAEPTPGAVAEADDYAPPAPGPVIDVTALDRALKSLPREDVRSLTLLQRVLKWLDELFESKTDGPSFEWLRDFRISDTLARWILYVSVALIVLGSIWIVVNELRHAGVLSRRRTARPDVEPGGVTPDLAHLTVADLVRVAPPDRPALLLTLIMKKIDQAHPGAGRASLTHREIVRAARFLGAPRDTLLETIARAAERVRYGAWLPTATQVDAVIGDGRVLLADLETAPRGAVSRASGA